MKWSYGEVKKPETINYRTSKPEPGGLFCERIFGPSKDWECYCGKYKNIRFKGIVCDRCKVEVTTSKVRRVRMGHIKLVVPVTHIWFLKGTPSRIGMLLDMRPKELESVVYYENYVVLHPGTSKEYKKKQLITVTSDQEIRKLKARYGKNFEVGIGAEAVKKLLDEIDLKALAEDTWKQLKRSRSVQKKKKLSKLYEMCVALQRSSNSPDWMILSAVPVIPPDLRPMVQLEGGRFATSDINDLYRRLINRNNRLKRLIEHKAPDIIIKNEKRMLQEAVDALFDNGQHGRLVRGVGNRPLKSLTDLLKGKQGRFRQNLLGKRVDYSGRAVIVIGPELKINQCGLPKRMALELFKPFVMGKLLDKGLVHNIKGAKKKIEAESPEVWDALEEVIEGHTVLLNRAPTLHRLGIQGFEPVMIEGKAMRLHPLVCSAFNADFDGDQMAVHVPLSKLARIEARILMLSTNNLFSPANGKCIAAPTQDIVLGIHYLTRPKGQKPESPKGLSMFRDTDEILHAIDAGLISFHQWIFLRAKGSRYITTAGRAIFNDVLPADEAYVNETMTKKFLSNVVSDILTRRGAYTTISILDSIKRLGYTYATRMGCSIGYFDDLIVPQKKKPILQSAEAEVQRYQDLYLAGKLTQEELHNRSIDIWSKVTKDITAAMVEEMVKDKDGFNPVYMMTFSGARGNIDQARQLAGIRGLMAKPSGEIIELPIKSNFKEGLTVLEYFISTHGARKGLADTALKTADAGYLTRRLVDVAQELVIEGHDCGTLDGIYVAAIREGEELIESLADRILGRVLQEDVVHQDTGEVLAKANTLVGEQLASKIEDSGVEKVFIRSVLSCESRRGICQLCYGRNLATGQLADIGEAVGVIAAQSIGEPGTQLTMRTFHIGGIAVGGATRELQLTYDVLVTEFPERTIERSEGKLDFRIVIRDGKLAVRKVKVRFETKEIKPKVFDGLWVKRGDVIGVSGGGKGEEFKSPEDGVVYLREGSILVMGAEQFYDVKIGTRIHVDPDALVPAGNIIAEFDPYNDTILSEVDGTTLFQDVIESRTFKEIVDESTGLIRKEIVEDREKKLLPRVTMESPSRKVPVTYDLPYGCILETDDMKKIRVGDVIAKIPRELSKTKDITGGLPRVEELFEARGKTPKDAFISHIDGVIGFDAKKVKAGHRKVVVTNTETGVKKEYDIPLGRYLKVREGDTVKQGEPLTDGPVNPHDILNVKEIKGLMLYLVNEVQEVYRRQGVDLNDKHIEIIVRQMLRKVEIKDQGDSEFSIGSLVDRFVLKEANEALIRQGKKPASFTPVLLGITKVSLETESFISAASFQETRRVLTDAAISGSKDMLRGLKENVIIGHLIPAGTGLKPYRSQLDGRPMDAEKILALLSVKQGEAPSDAPTPEEEPVSVA
ncbi:DNA-directed RNA polymerase subunit beta' [bacterium]|nr:DNA-directed RNA polymerase subunit beta' [bacterium]